METRKPVSRLGRQIRRWSAFRSPTDWIKDSYSRLLHNFPALPLPGRGTLCPVGLRMLPRPVWIRIASSDSAIVSEFAERDEYGWILPEIGEPIRTVVDLGGNFGLSMRFWDANIPSLESLVVVEPDADNMRAIVRNRDEMRIGPTLLEACAVGWNRPVGLRRGRSESAFTMEEGDHGDTVRTATMDAIVSHLPEPRRVDLLKCDIEGAERELFASCGDWIGLVRNMVVEVHGTYSTDDLRSDVERGGGRFTRVVASPHRGGVIAFFTDA